MDGHVHLSYQAMDDTSLHWITMRLTDVLDDGDRYRPSEPFRIVFKTIDDGITWISDYDGNWQEAFHRIRFTPDGTGFICGSGEIVLRKPGREMTPQAVSADLRRVELVVPMSRRHP